MIADRKEQAIVIREERQLAHGYLSIYDKRIGRAIDVPEPQSVVDPGTSQQPPVMRES
jgi:hypothetical protein